MLFKSYEAILLNLDFQNDSHHLYKRDIRRDGGIESGTVKNKFEGRPEYVKKVSEETE